jgi:hypothetical protein
VKPSSDYAWWHDLHAPFEEVRNILGWILPKDILFTSKSFARLEPVVHLQIPNYCFRARDFEVSCQQKENSETG